MLRSPPKVQFWWTLDTKIFGAPGAKNYGPNPKIVRACKYGRTSSIRMQSLVEIGGRTATEDEKQWCFCMYVCMFVCMFVIVTLDVQERGPYVQQRTCVM